VAKRTYKMVAIKMDRINAFGIVLAGLSVSSAKFTISSKPMYAKKISAAAPTIPSRPKGDWR
jgi:hypothetical protein